MNHANNRRNLTEGRGRLLTNTNKRTDKSPDFKGEIFVKGEVIRLSAWRKVTPYGDLISISVDDWVPAGEGREALASAA